jgi:hypothetical protein
MAATTIGLSTLTFGTVEASSSVVRSYEETISCDPIELVDGVGTFKAVAISNPNTSVSITLVSGTVSAGIGSAFSLDDTNTFLTGMDTSLFVESASLNLTNDGFAEVQISAVGYLNLNQAT